jgi:YVTN family beta-propeller protein
VSVISTATGTVVGSPVVVGSTPQALAVSPNGAYVYTANTGGGTVSVIATSTNTVIATIPVGSSPDSIAVNPVTGYVYVANSQTGTIEIISPGPRT